jgi:polyhydroxyalkanoate synthesis regulator phasin
MKFSTLAALVTMTTVGTAAHAGCATSTCPTDEQPTPAQHVTEFTVQRRIENALKDLEILNARAFATDAGLERRIENALKDLESATANAFKADQERLNELARKAGIDR